MDIITASSTPDNDRLRLTQTVITSGSGSKIGPADLKKLTSGIYQTPNPNLLAGIQTYDDAGVFKLADDLAIVQSADILTPVVKDPYWFGQIAVANALSDIYAMGAIPKTSLNLLGIPLYTYKISIVQKILEGGLHKLEEADVVLLGGHTIENTELTYGIAVTGWVHPQRFYTKQGVQKGNRLILTKPIGTGIISMAVKAQMVSGDIEDLTTLLMATLNRDAAEIMKQFSITACTDISGFGLLGHAAEMVENTDLGIRIFSEAVPLIPDVIDFAETGIMPVATHRNRNFWKQKIQMADSVNRFMKYVLFDPQISGGLLIAVQDEQANDLVSSLHSNGIQSAAIIGEVVDDAPGTILLV